MFAIIRNFLQDYKGQNDAFLTSQVDCKHAVITEEDKIFINHLFDLKS